MYKEELRCKDRVIIKKPKDIKEWPGWGEGMDELDGSTVTLCERGLKGETICYKGYYFNKKWLRRIPTEKEFNTASLVIVHDFQTNKDFAFYNTANFLLEPGQILHDLTCVTTEGNIYTISEAEVLGDFESFSKMIEFGGSVPSKYCEYYAAIDSIEEIEHPDYGIAGPKGMPSTLVISSYDELNKPVNRERITSEDREIVILSFPGSSKQYAYVNMTSYVLSSGYINDFGWITSNDEVKIAKLAKIENTFPSFEEYLKANRLNAFSQDISDYSCIYHIGSFEPCVFATLTEDKHSINRDETLISNVISSKDLLRFKCSTIPSISGTLCSSHPESAIIFPESKKESKMNFLDSLNINCGKVSDPNLTASLNGVAIKGLDGQFRAYDKSKDKIMNVTGLTLGNDYLYILPCALKDVKVGDVIVNADTFVTVIKVHNDGTFTVVDPKASEQKIAVPAQNIFGFNYVSKIVNLLDGMINPSDDNPFGINPLMFVLFDETKSDNNSNLLLATMLMGQNGDMDINSMLPLLLMGKGDNNMLTMFALMSMMKSQEKPKRGLRAKSKVIEDTTDTSNFSYDELCAAFEKILAERTKEKLDNAPVPAPIEDDSKPEYLVDDSTFVNYVPDGIVSYETDSAD